MSSMWSWAWGSGSGGGSSSSNSPSASGDHSAVADELAAGVDGVDLNAAAGTDRAETPVPEVDGSGAQYADLSRSLRVSRRGVLPPLVPTVWGAWTEDDLSSIQLRGASYVQDRVKVDCGPPIYRLVHVDTFYTDRDEPKVLKVTERDDCWVNIMRAKRAAKLAEGYQPTTKCRVCEPIPTWHDHPLNTTIVIDIVFPIKNINMYCVQYYERRIPPADVLREMQRAKEEAAAAAADASSVDASSHDSHKKKHKKKHKHRHASDAHAPDAEHDHEQDHEHDHDGEHDREHDGEHDHDHAADAQHDHASSSSSPYRFCCDGLEELDIERVAAFDRLLERFANGSDEFRDSTFKIIPRVAEGSWIVKRGVGRVPAILGRKVAQSYVRDVEKNVVEIDDDLANSKIAGQIVGLVKSYCKSIIVDMSFLFEGTDESVLPEALIGGLRYSRADMDKVQHFEDNARANTYPEY